MEQGINNGKQITTQVFTNSDGISANTGYQIRSDNNNNLTLQENERINNKENIVNGARYHLTRELGTLTISQDESIQIPSPNISNRIFAVRRDGNQFTLSRTAALTEYTFFTNNLQGNFNILGETGVRCAHVMNTTGKFIKIGLLHVTAFRTEGLIDRPYTFNLIQNNRNIREIVVNTTSTTGGRSTTMDIENLNVFVSQGDCIGIEYVPGANGRTGDYCQVRLTLDANARDRNYEDDLIP